MASLEQKVENFNFDQSFETEIIKKRTISVKKCRKM